MSCVPNKERETEREGERENIFKYPDTSLKLILTKQIIDRVSDSIPGRRSMS